MISTRHLLPCFLAILCTTAAPAQSFPLKFDFSSNPAKAGYTQVVPNTAYSDATGFGFEPSDKSLLFSAKVPEGNYTVTLTFGDSTATTTTVKAESGRLMLERVEVPARQIATRSFTTNVRTPHLPKLPLNATGREEVSLDQFDAGNTRDWDDKLTLEIVSPRPALHTIEIAPAPDAPPSSSPATPPSPTATAATT